MHFFSFNYVSHLHLPPFLYRILHLEIQHSIKVIFVVYAQLITHNHDSTTFPLCTSVFPHNVIKKILVFFGLYAETYIVQHNEESILFLPWVSTDIFPWKRQKHAICQYSICIVMWCTLLASRTFSCKTSNVGIAKKQHKYFMHSLLVRNPRGGNAQFASSSRCSWFLQSHNFHSALTIAVFHNMKSFT